MIAKYSQLVADIKDEKLKQFVSEAILEIPDSFFVIPASSSGEYHPKFALGDGGLIRHTIAAVYIGDELCTAYEFSNNSRDIVRAALILHDIGKAMDEPHEVVAAVKLKRLAKDRHFNLDPLVLETISAVRWHMGKWSFGAQDNSFESGSAVYPSTFSKVEEIVHLADYIASRPRLDFEGVE